MNKISTKQCQKYVFFILYNFSFVFPYATLIPHVDAVFSVRQALSKSQIETGAQKPLVFLSKNLLEFYLAQPLSYYLEAKVGRGSQDPSIWPLATLLFFWQKTFYFLLSMGTFLGSPLSPLYPCHRGKLCIFSPRTIVSYM